LSTLIIEAETRLQSLAIIVRENVPWKFYDKTRLIKERNEQVINGEVSTSSLSRTILNKCRIFICL